MCSGLEPSQHGEPQAQAKGFTDRREEKGSDFDITFGRTTSNGASNGNSFQYTGRQNDGTEIYYYRARFYQPTLQRFLSEDPIRFTGERR